MSWAVDVLGLGDKQAQLKVYIGNRPNMPDYQQLTGVRPLTQGDISDIGQACGNGWRKVFNVYAKLLYALNQPSLVPLNQAQKWQDYREHSLLQQDSKTSLLFTPPDLNQPVLAKSPVIHLVMGKTYAKTLAVATSLTWLDNEFALDQQAKLLVCPYFDYRQLSNSKIIRLVGLIDTLLDSD